MSNQTAFNLVNLHHLPYHSGSTPKKAPSPFSERSMTKKKKAAEFVRIYRKIYPKCGGMGVTVGGGHWSESVDIFSRFFTDSLLP